MDSDGSRQVWGAGGGPISAGCLRSAHLFLGNDIRRPVSRVRTTADPSVDPSASIVLPFVTKRHYSARG